MRDEMALNCFSRTHITSIQPNCKKQVHHKREYVDNQCDLTNSAIEILTG